MKCADCKEEIMQKNPKKCPYCGSTKFVSEKDLIPSILAEIKELKKTGKYEEAAMKYEELEMWDKAKEIRELNMGRVNTINMECPHCGTSQPLSSKNKKNQVKCVHCGKNYIIPKEVLEIF
jgi:DNA-directed RNA polymerase subunit RPC12/RpoP